MPDMTLCCNHSCRRADECYRHQAEPKETWQSYAYFDADGCKNFIDMEQLNDD